MKADDASSCSKQRASWFYPEPVQFTPVPYTLFH